MSAIAEQCKCPTCGHDVEPSDDAVTTARLCAGKHVTPRQLDAVEAFVRIKRVTGVAPTLEQLGRVLGVTKVTAYELTNGLAKAGVMRKVPNVSRGLELVEVGK